MEKAMPHPKGKAKTQTAPPPRAAPPAEVPRTSVFRNYLGKAETLLATHLDLLVWAIVLIGFYLRYERAADMYFNSDEQQIMLAPIKRGLLDVIRAAPLPYGPFMNIILHVMSFFGGSELYFRIPSIVAGALIPYAAYR